MNTSLSVVIPARDSRPWVAELLESVLRQDVEELEVVFVDNRSKDGTAEIVEEFAVRDRRVRLVRSDAATAAQARNEGVAVATGEYLVFADADDLVPDGAYRSMLEALRTSGSDMAIGDHLKFSPTETWSPTKRWGAFDQQRIGVEPEAAVELLTGRACWNRMFRRSFWDRAGMRFPEISSVDDIEPMTRAFVCARSLDVVTVPVYLYRDRSDGTSISQQSDAATTLRYIHQEIACARLLASRPRLRAQHALMVLDADGWAHVARFVASGPTADETESVAAALAELLGHIQTDVLTEVAPARRVLWALVLLGDWNVIAAFVRATDPRSSDARTRLDAWLSAMILLNAAGRTPVDIPSLVAEGLLPALINGADDVGVRWVAAALPELRRLPAARHQSGLRAAMSDAVESDDASAILAVAELRNIVPLVVRSASPTEGGLEISGAMTTSRTSLKLSLVLQSDSDVVVVPIRTTPNSWRASLSAATLRAGRWTVAVRATNIAEVFPVVTARMALPPVGQQFLIQPLADRKNGWRFLVDRRTPAKKGFAAALARFRGR